MREQTTIFLVGARACGKTTIGMALARYLQYNFIDTDSLVQKTVGCSVACMVAEHGWDFFRAAESKALHEATQCTSVIATGGGMVLDPRNREYMRKHGVVIFLSAPPKVLIQRLLAHPNTEQRPSLTAANGQYEQNIEEEVRNVLTARLPLYREVAHHTVDAIQKTSQILQNIVQMLRVPC